jgi:GR25 family glycosyltransferase involved in LPS biosynthesis
MQIKYYLIHCKEHKERQEHIDNFQNKFEQQINIFDGIYTKNVPLEKSLDYINAFNKTYNKNIIKKFSFKYSGEIGCYLSHFSIIEKIMNDKTNNTLDNDYTVIFEDDTDCNDKINPHEEIVKIINDINSINFDFDLIYLGNLNNNKGVDIINNIYYLDQENSCWGTHALLINNKNIEKIYNSILTIYHEIDIQYSFLGKKKIINSAVIYPSMFFQANYKSNIRVDPDNSKILKVNADTNVHFSNTQKRKLNRNLHLCTFETPINNDVSRDTPDVISAFKMKKGVKKQVSKMRF